MPCSIPKADGFTSLVLLQPSANRGSTNTEHSVQKDILMQAFCEAQRRA